ncbi:MAG: DUF1294 domain-containing protein [Firmicutes bacterium]|nr:DUF1294 domain-containing protein [Bacillota bacterium]
MKISEIIIIGLLIYNLITFLIMGIDKFLAKKEKRRISEATLLVNAYTLGGIGILLGMLVFRHKIRKAKFIILVPIAVIVNTVAFVGIYAILG